MSNKLKKYLRLIFLLCSSFAISVSLVAENQSNIGQLEKADKLFDSEKYVQSLEIYEGLYDENVYTERSLYRMAFMHENLKNYPEAIYYLRKVDREFGGELLEAKIQELRQRQGSSTFYTKDPVKSILRRYSWIVYLVGGICALWFAVFALTRKKKRMRWQIGVNWAMIIIFIPVFIIMLVSLFNSTNEAVIIRETSYYNEPGFASENKKEVYSPGEIVEIKERHDIWVKISTGSRKQYWVPGFCVREL